MADLQCPKCGKPSRGVCAECYLKTNPFSVKPETFRECECGLTFFKGRLYEDKDKEMMFRAVAAKSVKPPSGVTFKLLDVTAEYQRGDVVFDAKVQGAYSGNFFTRDVKWKIRPEKMKCDTCKKTGSGYYEAILQVRGDIDLILDEKKVASAESTRGGVDYYMMDMGYAQEKVQELINKGFLVKQSSKLFGKKNGKDVFRFYYSLKKPHFSVGDFIQYDGAVYRVREIAKMVKLTQLPSRKPTSAGMHRLEDSTVLAKSSSIKKALITEVRPDGMQLMDSEDCATYDVPPGEGLKQGDEVDYIRLGGKTYLL
jgi:nonsense-mediated mRNA decay protein 3